MRTLGCKDMGPWIRKDGRRWREEGDTSDKKENPPSRIFPVTIFVLTIYNVFSDRNLSSTAGTIPETSPVYLFVGVGCTISFIWTEPAVLYYLFATLGIETRRRTCLLYPFVGFFSSCIMPPVGGGQPAQVYYMRENMISMPVATVVLMVVTITYRLVLVVTDCLLAIFGQNFLNRYLYEVMPVYHLRLGFSVAFCVALLILAFRTSPTGDMVIWLLELLKHFHFLKKKIPRTEHPFFTVERYNDTAASLRQRRHVLLGVLFLTFYQRLALFSVTYSVYRAFGPEGAAILTLVLLQSTISVSVDMLPLPGSVGISEHLFLIIFDPIFYGDLLLSVMTLSRDVARHVRLRFNAAVTMYAHLTSVRKHRKAQKNYRGIST